MSSDSKFIYLLPKTGGLGWTDTFMIPKNADNPEGALKFIDFMLRPEVAAIVTEEGNTTTVSDAIKIADIENKELFEFTDEQISKLISVSYTHLDVYKRQHHVCFCYTHIKKSIRKFFCKNCSHC